MARLICRVCMGFMVLGLLLALILVLGYRTILNSAAEYLVLNETPGKSDAIVAVSGEHTRRRTAMKLYKDGLAPLLIFNISDTTYYFGRAIDPLESVLDAAGQEGIPLEDILINKDVSSTWEDAQAVRENVKAKNLRSLIVVSSPFNMRRVALTYRHVLKDSGVEICFVSVPLEQEKVTLEQWWTRERELQFVVNEYLKLTLYWFKYFH